jgi:hypothetical protein
VERQDSALLPPLKEETIGASNARRYVSSARARDLAPGDVIERVAGDNSRASGPITNIAPVSSGLSAGHLMITTRWGEPGVIHPDAYVGVSTATAERIKKAGGSTRDLGLSEVDSALLPPLKNSPTKTNWWEKVGGLPSLVTRIAKHLVSERGKTESVAIATAISQVRKVCASGRTFGGKTAVHGDTKAEYCKAAAEIEAKRAAAKAKSAVKEIEMTEEDAASLALAASAKLGVLAEELGPDFIWGAIRERDVSTGARQKMASKGSAMKDGSFPIANVGDLKNAIRAIGRAPAGKRNAVKALIKRRAKELGATNALPKDWKVAEEISEEVIALNAILEVFGDAEAVEEAFVIPSLSKLRSTVRANRRADNSKSKSSSSSSSSGHKRAPAGSPIGGQFIKTGASGPVVTGLQKRLGIKTTGTFGGNTKTAIEKFQKNHGLTVDGIIGRQTATALLTNGKKKVATGHLTTGIKSRLKHRYG